MIFRAFKVSKYVLAIGFGVLFIALCAPIGLSALNSNVGKLTPIYQGNIQQKKIAFGCNVFWGEEYLPAMLKNMSDENVHITFFLGGSWAKKHPDIVMEMAVQAHELANHSFTHPHPNALSKQQNIEQIMKTEELIYSITEKKTTLYAPPYGEFNQTVLEAAQEAGYKTIMWTIDTVDWKRPSSEIIKNRVLKKVQNGAIILIHPTAPTLEAMPSLLRELKQMGYEIVPVSEVL